MPESWTIGSDADCDLVVDRPTVSRRHCRLTRDADGYSLDDLGSSNGTFVNGRRISGPVRVTRDDAITLGANVPLPWPSDGPPLARAVSLRGDAMVIGRDPDCDLVLEVPVVSGRHARLTRSGDLVLIEDLGSSNGTYLNDQRVDRPTAVHPGDRIGLGSFALVFAEEAPSAAPRQTVTDLSAPVQAPVVPGSARMPAHPWLLAALLGQVLPVSVAVAMLRGSDAVVLSWLGLAAFWFGLSNALLANTFDAAQPATSRGPGGVAGLVRRLALLGGLGVVQCVVAWAIVSQVAGLGGAAGVQLMLLVLASAVGAALGLVIVLLIPGPAPSWVLVAPIMLMLWILGGERWPVSGMAGWARVVSNAVPTRWAFEGLLLAEDTEQAERYFPAATERMGVKADAVALLAMLIGLAAAAAFIAEDSRRGPSARATPTAT